MTYTTVGEELRAENPVIKDGKKVVVIVTHDEMTIYSNDCKPHVWMESGKQKTVHNVLRALLRLS